MGAKKFWTGIISGAVVGGLISLFNEDAREYVKDLASSTGEKCLYIVNNPTETVKNIKEMAQLVDEKISENKNSAFNALEQVENTLERVTKRK